MSGPPTDGTTTRPDGSCASCGLTCCAPGTCCYGLGCGRAARLDGAARVFAPNGAMCKFSPNDPVWTGAICACGPLECKAGIHPCATRPDGAAIRRALQKGGIEHHDLQGSDIDAWHDRDKCRICAALADLDVLLRERDEAREALDFYNGAFCDMCGSRYAGEVPACDCGPRGTMIPGSDLASALSFMREHLDESVDAWREEWEEQKERAEKAVAQRDEAQLAYRRGTQHWVDGTCHYRNLAIRYGAQPDEMLNSYDRDLAARHVPDDPDGWENELPDVWAELEAAEAEREELRARLQRATYVAKNLHAMIDRETWRATGGDDQQGHYEGDYHAEQLRAEIEGWEDLGAPEAPVVPQR